MARHCDGCRRDRMRTRDRGAVRTRRSYCETLPGSCDYRIVRTLSTYHAETTGPSAVQRTVRGTSGWSPAKQWTTGGAGKIASLRYCQGDDYERFRRDIFTMVRRHVICAADRVDLRDPPCRGRRGAGARACFTKRQDLAARVRREGRAAASGNLPAVGLRRIVARPELHPRTGRDGDVPRDVDGADGIPSLRRDRRISRRHDAGADSPWHRRKRPSGAAREICRRGPRCRDGRQGFLASA